MPSQTLKTRRHLKSALWGFGIFIAILILINIFALDSVHEASVRKYENFIAALFDGGTTYAPGFSQIKFNTIRKSMTDTQVRDLIGAPLFIYSGNGHVYYHYTIDPQDRSRWIKSVEFDAATSTVLSTNDEFYVD